MTKLSRLEQEISKLRPDYKKVCLDPHKLFNSQFEYVKFPVLLTQIESHA